jgi:hypothetical protein
MLVGRWLLWVLVLGLLCVLRRILRLLWLLLVLWWLLLVPLVGVLRLWLWHAVVRSTSHGLLWHGLLWHGLLWHALLCCLLCGIGGLV